MPRVRLEPAAVADAAGGSVIAPRSIVRMAWRCAVWLAVGLVLTVAVSWGLAAWMPQRDWDEQFVRITSTEFYERPATLFLQRFRTFGATRQTWYLQTEQGPVAGQLDLVGQKTATPPLVITYNEDVVQFRWLRWGFVPYAVAEFARASNDGAPTSVNAWFLVNHGVSAEQGTGWPFRAFWCSLSGETAAGAMPIPPTADYPYADRALPYLPIWPGLALDSVIWGAVAIAGVSASRLTRCALRRRRGLCPACAYPVGASPVCTECGAAVTPRPQAA